MNGAQKVRAQQLAVSVHRLGSRAMYEFIAEMVDRHGDAILDRLEDFAAIDPDILRAIGADKFPPFLWCVA